MLHVNSVKTEIARFLMAGTLVNITDVSIYFCLFHFMYFSVAKAISFTCAGIIGYLLNKYWTFQCDQNSFSHMGRYMFINFLALGSNVLTNQSILSLYPHAVLQALLAASLITSIFIFLSFKIWVFKKLTHSSSLNVEHIKYKGRMIEEAFYE